MFTSRIINAPRKATIEMLLRRTAPQFREQLAGKNFDAVGLIQTDLPNLFYLADVGQKAGAVIASEVLGNCPQHVNTVAFFGDTTAVESAVKAAKMAYNEK